MKTICRFNGSSRLDLPWFYLLVIWNLFAHGTMVVGQQDVQLPREKIVIVDPVLDRIDRPVINFNIEGHTAPIFALEFDPDGSRLFSAGRDKVVKIWN